MSDPAAPYGAPMPDLAAMRTVWNRVKDWPGVVIIDDPGGEFRVECADPTRWMTIDVATNKVTIVHGDRIETFQVTLP